MNQLLFLCSGNYYRSRYAEELFNYSARASSVGWRAVSRGIRLNPNNQGPIADIVPRRLASLGIEPVNVDRAPEALTNTDLADAALVVAMSWQEHYPLMVRAFPAYAEKVTYWDVEDTGKMASDVAFGKLEALVYRLIDELHRSQ